MNSLNRETQGVRKGLIVTGSSHNLTVYLKHNNVDNIKIGDFVTLDLADNPPASKPGDPNLRGMITVKKIGTPTNDVPFGVVVSNTKRDNFSVKAKRTVLTIAPYNKGVVIYAEANGSDFKPGDALQLDTAKGIHTVKKKTTDKQVGIALEKANAIGDLVRILLKK